MKKLKEFEKNYEDACAIIQKYLKPSKMEPSMHELCAWMLKTDANPYAYLPESMAGGMDSAQGFVGILRTIEHALYDDGDLTFVSVNGEPRMVFASAHEPGFERFVLSDTEKQIAENVYFKGKTTYEIKVLDITPSEFGPLYDAYQEKDLKRCFIQDAATQGVKWATKHYERYALFNEKWISECEEEITHKKDLRRRSGLG